MPGPSQAFADALRRVVDGAIEAPVVTSYTRIGAEIRSRLDHWSAPRPGSLGGRVVLLTGGTSGLGRAAASALAGAGACVVITGRTAMRSREVAAQLARTSGGRVEAESCDLGDLDAVRALAERVLARHDRLDVLVHNAGALSATRHESPQGFEHTVASQVYGPFVLTTALLPLVQATGSGRVLTVSSGGMYTSRLEVEHLEMSPTAYRGAEQYARAKRAQVTLNEMWAERTSDVVFHAMHPGWADTPGVAESLPAFRRAVGPLLRTAAQGADTLVWLAAGDHEPLASSGGFWLDRRRRGLHRLPHTALSDTPARRDALWRLVAERAGVDTVPVRG
ncbi:MAG: SDR family NAD(P)-dependent oxidoreductase [Acidimicrobiales bacterium]|nr:SDR family NAD(P)-dependent oxidoreductase [Acidimicrobiales bacterium]MCB9394484.1 SDR family NAD(P)-dependent oxidoreductase [Acidimicrobiaceae bacterium]